MPHWPEDLRSARALYLVGTLVNTGWGHHSPPRPKPRPAPLGPQQGLSLTSSAFSLLHCGPYAKVLLIPCTGQGFTPNCLNANTAGSNRKQLITSSGGRINRASHCSNRKDPGRGGPFGNDRGSSQNDNRASDCAYVWMRMRPLLPRPTYFGSVRW